MANKCDLEKKYWKVTKKEYTEFAKKESLEVFEASAKTGVGVMEAFNYLMESVCTVAQPIASNQNLLGKKSSSSSGCC